MLRHELAHKAARILLDWTTVGWRSVEGAGKVRQSTGLLTVLMLRLVCAEHVREPGLKTRPISGLA